MRMLKPTGPSRQQQYGELRDLVGEIARTAPADASRFDLQGLLDHFVRLAVEHQRCVESLRLATGLDGPRALLLESPHARHRRDIRERRLRHRDECMQRIGWLTDELEAIEELVRLVAQRAAYPTFDPEADGELERRLWELDEVDAALGQLSA